MKQKMIDFLLENANPSIRLRVKKEILKTITKQEEKQLQEQIQEEKIIKFLKEKQLETDWRAKIRRQCDVTFRALLIVHYAGIMADRRIWNTKQGTGRTDAVLE